MKKKIFTLICIFLTMTGCNKSQKEANGTNKRPIIGIFSPLYHASLDAEISGFKQGLQDVGLKSGVDFEYEEVNANSDFSKISFYLENLFQKSPKLIFVVTTPASTQAAILCKKYNIPIVYGAVTDPVNAKVVDSMDQSVLPITGVSDRYPVKAQCEFFKDFLTSKSEQKAAILYSPQEQNSQILSQETERYLKEFGVGAERISVQQITDLSFITERTAKKFSLIIVNGDNAITEKIAVVASICRRYKKPLFVGDPLSVKFGAIASLGPDYYKMGIDAAKKAKMIFSGESAGKIPSSYPLGFESVVNPKAAKEIGFDIPGKVWLKNAIWKSANE